MTIPASEPASQPALASGPTADAAPPGAGQLPDDAVERLDGALAGPRRLQDGMGALAVGPLQFGPTAAAMDFAWTVAEAGDYHAERLLELQADVERARDLALAARAGGDAASVAGPEATCAMPGGGDHA